MPRLLPPAAGVAFLAAFGLSAAVSPTAHAEETVPSPTLPAPSVASPDALTSADPTATEEPPAAPPAAQTPAVAPPTMNASAQAKAAAPTTNEELEHRVRELEETVRQLRELIQKQNPAPPSDPPAADPKQVEKIVDERLKARKPTTGFEYGKGFYIQSADGNFELRLRAMLHSTFRAFTSEAGRTGIDNFYIRRARPILEGTLNKNIDFRIAVDYGLGNSTLFDAYLDLKHLPQAQIRIGKFKEPVSIERIQAATDITFIERSIANSLAPNRDIGIQVSGDVLKTRLSYAIAAFDGAPDIGSVDGDTDSDKDVIARLFAHPFRLQKGHPLEGLGLGVSTTYGRRTASPSPNYRTGGRTTMFRYGNDVTATGEQFRVVPQMYYYRGPFSFMGEFLTSRQDVQRGPRRGRLENQGWFAQASYVLTGEHATYRSLVPRREFDPKRGRWGAFEIAARFAELDIDDGFFRGGPANRFADPDASISGAHAWTVGLNWYLNRLLRVQFNYERVNFDGDGILINGVRRGHEDLFLAQFQVAF